MSVSIGSLTFYNPSTSVSIGFVSDGDGNKIGRKDTVSVTDIVTFDDTADVVAPYNAALALSVGAQYIDVSYPGGSGKGLIKSVSIDGDSDYAYKLSYTITVEVRPDVSISSVYSDIIGSKKVSSLSFTVSEEIPYDIATISPPGGGGPYQNKGKTKSVSVQVTCIGTTRKEDTKSIVDRLIEESGIGTGENDIITSVSSSLGADGGLSVDITAMDVPQSMFATAELSKSKNGVDNTEEKTYKITFTGVEGLVYDSDYKVTGYSSGLSDSAYSAANEVYSYFVEQRDITTTDLSLPGILQPCDTDLPKITTTSCWKAKTISLENNKGGNSASVTVELTTAASNDCDRNGFKTDYSITRYDEQPTYVEVDKWLGDGYVVQNFNTKKSKYNEYSVDITALRNCVENPEVVSRAKEIFESIREGGKITSYVINIGKQSCSLKATEYFD